MTRRVPPEDKPILAALRGRQRCSYSYLACLLGMPERALRARLKEKPLVDTLARHGWRLTDSKALGLPALLHGPPVPMLVR